MKLDKSHLDQFENISPPMRHALTIPVEINKPLAGICIYVCCSAFDSRGTRKDVLEVAKDLMLGSEMPSLSVAESAILLLEQTIATRPDYKAPGLRDYSRAWAIIERWRGKQDDSKDLLDTLEEAKAALVGGSNDAEHDALVSFVQAMGLEIPVCDCDERSWQGEGHDSACPSRAWESESTGPEPDTFAHTDGIREGGK